MSATEEEIPDTAFNRYLRSGGHLAAAVDLAKDEAGDEIEVAAYMLFRYDDLSGFPLRDRKDYIGRALLMRDHFRPDSSVRFDGQKP